MFRILFVAIIILIGVFSLFYGPFYALLFYLWNAYFRPESWLWTDALYQVRLSLLIYVFLIISAATSALQRFRLTLQTGFVLLFVLQSLVALMFSEHRDATVDYWIEFVKVIGILLFITFLVADERKFRLTFLVIGYSLGFEAAKQGWVQLVLNPGATNANPIAFLGDNNGVALGMFMLIPLFVALVATSKTTWEKRIHQFFIVGLAYRGISTYSRGGFLAGGVLAVLTVVRSRHKVRTTIVLVALVAVVLSVMPEKFFDRMQTITASDEDRDSSALGRLHYWQVAQEMVKAKPLTGVGFNGFRDSYSSYEFEEGWGTNRSPHSAWFGVMAEMGIPGIVLFVLILLGAINSTRRVRRSALESGNASLAAYATALQSAFLVYTMGATFLSAQYNEMFWHLIGLSIALERIQRESAVATGGSRPVSAVAVRRAMA